jgi:hypothetical protein
MTKLELIQLLRDSGELTCQVSKSYELDGWHLNVRVSLEIDSETVLSSESSCSLAD